jgi:hypothetical protein
MTNYSDFESNRPDELEAIEARLREQRDEADPLQLDRIKQRAIAQFSARPGQATKSRIAAVFSVLALAGGTGGAIAVASNPGTGHGGSAESGQYCPPVGTGDPDRTGDVHSNCHTGSKFRGAGGEDKGATITTAAPTTKKH